MDVKYLNTDLEIESKSDLSEIVKEFGEDVFLHHNGEIRGYQHASFSIAGGSTGADATIDFFCTLVEQFPKDIREIWDGCCSRLFDIGYESGTSPQNFRSEIRAATIQRVAKIGASVVVTIYPETKESASGNATS
ncbi:MAG TPA: hypothetical protein VIT19_11300 [Pyrinomonadaceae bacterium]